MAPSRMPSWLGWQLSNEVRQFSAPLQAHEMCCHARLASSFPAQLFCAHDQHCLHCASLLNCLCTSWGAAATSSAKERERERRAVQETALCGCGSRGGSCSITPSSCGAAGESPYSCTGLHLPTPHPFCSLPQPQGSGILADYTRAQASSFPHFPCSPCAVFAAHPPPQCLLFSPAGQSLSDSLGADSSSWLLTVGCLVAMVPVSSLGFACSSPESPRLWLSSALQS